MNNQLTLDYGVRFVHAAAAARQPAAERQFPAGQVVAVGRAAALRRRLRQQRESVHGHQPSGDESDHRSAPGSEHDAGDRHAGAEHRQPDQRPVPVGQGIEKTTYTFPMLNVGPRFGMAYDVNGKQRFVLRGAWGVYFDRPRPGDAQALVGNPRAPASSPCATASCRA